MIGATGLAVVTSSVLIAYLASRRQTHTKALQLLGGFALIGWALPHIERL
jgi:hypothetical protein